MNIKQAYQLGVASGLEAGELGDFTKEELSSEEDFSNAHFETCQNKRQYAGHPGYDFNREPNAEGLWDAFEEGEAVGGRKAWRERLKENRKTKVTSGHGASTSS